MFGHHENPARKRSLSDGKGADGRAKEAFAGFQVGFDSPHLHQIF